ncbi:hypothetical protein LN42_00465 [Marinitoga sp. 1137]|uniref:helix-turn-helix transcriptional regulator n=1 Tax=Marinitoga sp. 1137 TaxID=1545835 RepID=UPI00095076F5|nr:helix-turn-helix transcriptional regulator [Marinitoga sp. 1137]APT75038.1 hypothetical protein LN42_00465 [Marinitoga sp. 1137]
MKNNLKELRTKKNLTLNQLAKMTGLNQATIWRIENGIIIPKIDTAQKIAKVLEVNVENLFNLSVAERR